MTPFVMPRSVKEEPVDEDEEEEDEPHSDRIDEESHSMISDGSCENTKSAQAHPILSALFA